MKVREVVKRIEADGWYFARQGGRSSHRVYEKSGVPDKSLFPAVTQKKSFPDSFRIYGENRDCHCVEGVT